MNENIKKLEFYITEIENSFTEKANKVTLGEAKWDSDYSRCEVKSTLKNICPEIRKSALNIMKSLKEIN